MAPLLELYDESGISFLNITDEMISKEPKPYIPDLDINKSEMIEMYAEHKKKILVSYNQYRKALEAKDREESERLHDLLEHDIYDLQYLLTPYIQNYELK